MTAPRSARWPLLADLGGLFVHPVSTRAPRRIRLLANPRAGGDASAAARLVDRWQAAAGPADAFDHRITASAAEAVRALEGLGRGDRVVVAGGDGSVQAVLATVLAQGLELAVLPAGSGNDFAAALGWQRRRIDRAIEASLHAPARPIDLMQVRVDARATWAASSVTIGFDAAVAERAAVLPRRLGGLGRYLAATLLELVRLQPQVLQRQADGEAPQDGCTLFASVLNTPTYGGGMPMARGARLDDGRLDAVVAGRFGRLEALAMLPLVLVGRHLDHPRVQRLAVRRFEVRAPAGSTTAVGVDGESLGRASRIEVDVVTGGIPAVVAPSGSACTGLP